MGLRNIYVLSVAIDAYGHGLRPLRGCLNDQQTLASHLVRYHQNKQCHVHLKTMKNAEATREAVISGFRHFDQAIDNDICLFHFSGHGSLIPTIDFWEAFNGCNQTILCADSTADSSANDIVDKELSWLIHRAIGNRQVHFVVIMDCCHSGGNTRTNAQGSFRLVTRGPWARVERTLSAYLGHGDYIPDGKGRWSAPKAKHLALSACLAHQVAAEIHAGHLIQGAFTASLLESLREPEIPKTYAGIESAVNRRLRAYGIDQHMQAEGVAGAVLQDAFLGGTVSTKNPYLIEWNSNLERHELNAGFLSGIAPGTKLIGKSENCRNQLFQLVEVLLDTAVVSGKRWSYPPGVLEVIPIPDELRSVRVSLALVSDVSQRRTLAALFGQSDQPFCRLTDDPAEADFCVTRQTGAYGFCRSGFEQPLFQPVPAAQEFWEQVWAVLKWQYLLRLENPLTAITRAEYKVAWFGSSGADWWDFDTYTMLADTAEGYVFPWREVDEEWCAPGFGLRITNTGNRPLYVSALYLSGRFGIENGYLPLQYLAVGEHAWLSWTDEEGCTHQGIGLTIDDRHWAAGLELIEDYVKLFIADGPFSTNLLNQPGLDILPLPISRGGQNSRRGTVAGIDGLLEKKDWTTECYPVKIIKPYPHQII